MSFDDAVAALEGAIETDNADETNESSLFKPAPEAPAQQAAEPSAPQGTPAPESAAPQPAAPATPAAPAVPVDTFDGGKFNPDSLPDELKPAWHQLQAAFTQKTQDVAEQKKQIESLGDINDLANAAKLYEQMKDPRNWHQLQTELGELMEQHGIRPTAATPAPAAPVTPTTPAYDLSALEADPDLAPVAGIVKGLQTELQEMKQSIVAEREALQKEQEMMSIVGEIQRQEGILRQQGYSDADMDRIADIATAHKGNLLVAAEKFEGWKQEILTNYLASKTEVANTPVAPIQGGQTVSTTPRKPATFEEATDIAIETLKAAGLDTLDM